MATVKSFEDLICWQRARELTKFIYTITKDSNFAKDFGLVDQIRRAAVSVMSNVAEGFDRGTKLELINFFFIAKGSCGEVRSQLYIAMDVRYIDMPAFRNGLRLTDEVSRLIQSFIDKVKAGSRTGLQYQPKKSNGDEALKKLFEKFNYTPKYQDSK